MNITTLIEHSPKLSPYLNLLPSDLYTKCILKTYPKGHVFHYKGDTIQNIHILYEGSVQVKNDFETGQSYVIECNNPIDIIGDVSLLAKKEKASVTIEALSSCSTIQLSRYDFEDWLNTAPELVYLIAKHVADKLYASSSNHGTEIFYTPPQLVINFLLSYSDEHYSSALDVVTVKLTRQEISDHLGISPRTINRTLKDFKVKNLIFIHKGKICFSPEQRQLLYLESKNSF